MSLCNYAQPRRVFRRWFRGSATVPLDKNYLQRVPALNARNLCTVVFANCEQIDHTH